MRIAPRLLFIILLGIVVTTAAGYAADADTTGEPKTIFGDAPFTSGGFGGPVVKIGSVNGQAGLFVGGRGGWVINKTFVIGGGGYGLVTTNTITGYPNAVLQVGYGGGELEWVFASDEAVHATAMLLIGAGSAQVRSDTASMFDDGHARSIASTTFFILEPQISVEMNLTRWFRIGAGASYRWTNGASMTPGEARIDDASLRGLSGVITFKFGVY